MLGTDPGLSDQQVILSAHILQSPVSCQRKRLTTLLSSYDALAVSCSYCQLKDSLRLGSHWVIEQNSGCQTLKPTHPLILSSIFGGFSTSNKETSTIPGIMIINSHQCRRSLYFSVFLIAIQHCLLFVCILPDFLRLSLPLCILDPFLLPFLFISSSLTLNTSAPYRLGCGI